MRCRQVGICRYIFCRKLRVKVTAHIFNCPGNHIALVMAARIVFWEQKDGKQVVKRKGGVNKMLMTVTHFQCAVNILPHRNGFFIQGNGGGRI